MIHSAQNVAFYSANQACDVVNAAVSTAESPAPESSALLRTLVLCDLVNSTALVENMGDREAAELIRKHDRLARTIADRHGGREIDKTDGFLMMFERPIQAVGFALDYQRGLRQLNAAEGLTLSARVGIHVGDVVVWENNREDIARGAKQVEVEGLVKPIASRLMSLALPGQVLLSNFAYDLAHRAQGELGIKLEKVRWRTHGRYRFRGIPDPVAVFEVGEDGLAPLKAPPWSSKAHREVPFWRRPATVVIEALVVAALIAIPVYMFVKPEPAIAFANRDWVVIGSLHNLTGETVFDDALESALRIGLEQSRYVNVMPDLKVRDTIKRMERDPDATEIDRAIGSEVAIRDGARALILPTIAEIGGRVRITAEVIDPQTQTTVYSESADGIGAESVLPSLDTINGRLRVRLGEALATVSNESLPLEKVGTANLDALRSYTLAIRATARGDAVHAERMLENTLTLDPSFARARIALGVSKLVRGKREEAKALLEGTLRDPGRMSSLDRLMAEAWLGDFHSPKEALDSWKVLAETYPDSFPAQGAYAFYAWNVANDYRVAAQAAFNNVSEKNANRQLGHYMLGTLLLGMERYEESRQQFRLSEEGSASFTNNYHAALYAAMRRNNDIEPVLARARSASDDSEKRETRIHVLARALDQGRWRDVSVRDSKASSEDSEVDAQLGAKVSIVDSSERLLLAGLSSESKKKLLAGINESSPIERKKHVLFRTWLAAAYAGSSLTEQYLEQLRASFSNANHPAFGKMWVLIDAEIALAKNHPDRAVSLLNSILDGNELYATHWSLMRAYERSGNMSAARDQARWLGRNRGRAYTEASMGPLFIPFNVAQSNLALLRDAELSLELKDLDESKKSLSAFEQIWSNDGTPGWLSLRISKLKKALESS